MSLTIRIFVVEDNRLLREGIVTRLDSYPDISVVASAENTDMALREIRETRTEVVLVDAGLGDDDSHRLVECLTKMPFQVGVIMMDLLPSRDEIARFIEAGAAGFIMKNATADAIVSTIRSVASGEKVTGDIGAGSLLSQIALQAADRPIPDVIRTVSMTGRERKMITMIAEGLGNQEIARRLHLSPKAVRSYVRNILEKLALRESLQSEIDPPS